MIMLRPGGPRGTTSFRKRIVRENAEVDTEIVRAIVQNEAPRLLERSEALLEESDHGG